MNQLDKFHCILARSAFVDDQIVRVRFTHPYCPDSVALHTSLLDQTSSCDPAVISKNAAMPDHTAALTRDDLRAAFAPTLQASKALPKPYSAADAGLLQDIARPLTKLGVI